MKLKNMAGMSKRVFLLFAASLMCGCSAGKSVDNPGKEEEKVWKSTELSTEVGADVEKSVDNIENNSEQLDISEESTGIKEDKDELDVVTKYALSQAEEYYFYYASQAALHGINAGLLFSRKEFLNAWNAGCEQTLEDLFEETGWFDRGEFYSLKFMPRPCMFDYNNDDVYTWMARCIRGFILAKEKYSGDDLWDHEASLVPQYHCHTIYAGSKKVPWYIEPHRTETDFLIILAAKGNPEP